MAVISVGEDGVGGSDNNTDGSNIDGTEVVIVIMIVDGDVIDVVAGDGGGETDNDSDSGEDDKSCDVM